MNSHLNIFCIVKDFWCALTRELNFAQTTLVVITFIAMPIFLGILSFSYCVIIPSEQFSALISVYAIFSALLFGAQVSAFSIFKSMADFQKEQASIPEEDSILRESIIETTSERLKNLSLAFKDINSNISYLIMNSVTLLTIVLALVLRGSSGVLSTSILVGFTSHLIITLVMIIKQCHLVFNAAYSEN